MDPFIGEIKLFAGNFAPRGWAFCEGQLLPISQNTALFSILGTTYGGDGRTTFALPDLRGRVSIHPGHGPGLSNYFLGAKGGQEHVTLMINQMPSHNHEVRASSQGGNSPSPGNAVLGNTGGFDAEYVHNQPPDLIMNPSMVTNAGGNQPHENRQPYLAVNYIIALQGIFPSRS